MGYDPILDGAPDLQERRSSAIRGTERRRARAESYDPILDFRPSGPDPIETSAAVARSPEPREVQPSMPAGSWAAARGLSRPEPDPTPRISLRGSVLDNMPNPARPRAIEDVGAPLSVEGQRQVQEAYNSASPAKRAAMSARTDFVGGASRALDRRYEDANPTALRALSGRKEDVIASRIEQGELPSVAESSYAYGYGKDREVGSAEQTGFDFERAQFFRDNPNIASASRIATGIEDAYGSALDGFGLAVKDALGLDTSVDRDRLFKEKTRDMQNSAEVGQAVGARRNFEGAVTSIATQLPWMAAGVATGTGTVPLAAMIAQSWGESYKDGFQAGLSPGENATRASLFAAFEGLGEGVGLGKLFKTFNRSLADVPTNQLTDAMAIYVAKQVPGEVATTTGQFITDKLPGLGLNQDATLKDYLNQVGDTILTSVIQGGLMYGGAKGLGKVRDRLETDNGLVSRAIQGGVDSSEFDRRAIDAAAIDSMRTVDPRYIDPSQTTLPRTPEITQRGTTAAAPQAEVLPANNTSEDVNNSSQTSTPVSEQQSFNDSLERDLQAVSSVDEDGQKVQDTAESTAPPAQEAGDSIAPPVQAENQEGTAPPVAATDAPAEDWTPTIDLPGPGSYSGIRTQPVSTQRKYVEENVAPVLAENFGIENVSLATPEAIGEERFDALKRLSLAYKKLYDIDVVLVDPAESTRLDGNGKPIVAPHGYYAGDGKTLVLNARSSELTEALTHEAVHAFEQNNPDLFAPLYQASASLVQPVALKAMLDTYGLLQKDGAATQLGQVVDALVANPADQAARQQLATILSDPADPNNALARSELVAHIAGHAATPAMYRELVRRSGGEGKAAKIIQALTDFLNTTYEKLFNKRVQYLKGPEGLRQVQRMLNEIQSEVQVRTAQQRTEAKQAAQKPAQTVAAPVAAQPAPTATPSPTVAPSATPTSVNQLPAITRSDANAQLEALLAAPDSRLKKARAMLVVKKMVGSGLIPANQLGRFEKLNNDQDKGAEELIEAALNVKPKAEKAAAKKVPSINADNQPASEFSDLEKSLQSKTRDTEQDGDVGVVVPSGKVRYVSMADAVETARAAIASGAKAVPYQIHRATGIRLGDTDRVLKEIQAGDATGAAGSPGTPQAANEATPAKKGVMTRKQAEDKFDDLGIDPETKKSQVMSLAKKMIASGLMPADEMGNLEQINRDRDMGPEDLLGEMEPYVREEANDEPRPKYSLVRNAVPGETEISTQNPTAKGRTYDPITQMLSIDGAAVQEAAQESSKSGDDNIKERIIDAILDYGFIPRDTPRDSAIEVFKKNVISNLLYLYNSVPKETANRSRLWYDGAFKIATEMGRDYNLKMEQVAAIMAAMSPQKDWFQNVSMAERAIDILTNQGDTKWDSSMLAYARSYIFEATDAVEREKRQDAYDRAVKVMDAGTSLKDMNEKDAAAFVRAYDEAFNSRQYRIVTPEGGFSGLVKKNDGEPATMMWSTYGPIEKAVSIFRNGSRENISEQLGDEHKIRSFYNNIAAPNSPIGHVTIDTHAVAAALFEALSGTDAPVTQNFGGTGKSSKLGVGGTYGIIADAYREAAKQVGILPREMQSITWEAVRGMFGADEKSSIKKPVRAVWDQYRDGKISFEAAREKIVEVAGGINEPDWTGSDAGQFVKDGGTSYDKEYVPEGGVRLREAKELRQKTTINLTAATSSIPGIKDLYDRAMAGDQDAGKLIQRVAESSLRFLLSGTKAKIKVEDALGVYASEREPAISLSVSFNDSESVAVLAALSRFAQMYNQEQIHVRTPTSRTVGHEFGDGSYSTVVHEIPVNRQMSGEEISDLVAQSGLGGLSVTADLITTYWVRPNGNPEDHIASYSEYQAGVARIYGLVGTKSERNQQTYQRLSAYGRGAGATAGYERIDGDVRTKQASDTQTPRLVAEFLKKGPVEPFKQKPLNKAQVADQKTLSSVFEALPTNDLRNPLVQRAYEAAAAEIATQYKALPIKVEVMATVKIGDAVYPYWGPRSQELTDRLIADGMPQAKAKIVLDYLRKNYGEPSKSWKTKGWKGSSAGLIEAMNGDVYPNSAAMRRDVSQNNRLKTFKTSPKTFGPEGSDFTGNPLLKDSGLVDVNGYPMLYNDLLRAVHDYFAHNLSATEFGPNGEAAAWRNHMASTTDPMARWAITSETRLQNAWQNFRPGVENVPLKDRKFSEQKAALPPVAFTLTGNDLVDAPMLEFIKTLSEEQRRGSLPADSDIKVPALPESVSEAKFSLQVPVKRIEPGKKNIDERFDELQDAARKVESGEMTPAEYGALANSPQFLGAIAPYDFIPAPATDADALGVLTAKQQINWNRLDDIKEGDRVGLRLDIPAYTRNGVWVNSIHPSNKDAGVRYAPVSALTDATFPDAKKAMIVAQGASKSPFAQILGKWLPVTNEEAIAKMQEGFDSWTQVGYNPLRHSYFFDRKTGNPVTAADEVVQIGPLVLAKNATIESPDAVDENGNRKFLFSRQIESPEFKQWFGDSKVVDADGKALRVYTGTSKDKDFSKFNVPKNGAWFTTSPSLASEYATENDSKDIKYNRDTRQYEEVNTASRVMPVYLRIENPATLSEADSQAMRMAGNYKKVQGQIFDRLRAQGHDGVDLGDGVWVVIGSPNQIKSAIGNNGEFSLKSPDIRFSVPVPPFYSALAREVDAIKMNAGPAAGWKSAIKGMINKGAIKADEVEWSGVNDWLDLQQGKVTKQAISDYLKDGGVRVEETVLGASKEKSGWRVYSELGQDSEVFDTEEQAFAERQRQINEWEEQGGNVDDAEEGIGVEQVSPRTKGAKYGAYTLPGGENYREVLLTLPLKKVSGRRKELLDRVRRGDELSEDENREYNRLENRESYRSNHWDQPNVISHIRVNDRTDADGKRVLFVEEIQSDWGQEGKKRGFDNREAVLSAELQAAGWRLEQVENYWVVYDRDNDAMGDGPTREVALERAGAGPNNIRAIPAAPFVTKTEGWLNLSLKRVITMAVEGGYDRVAFVNGEQSADRYDLSKQVDEITYEPTAKGYSINVIAGGRNIKQGDFTRSELEDIVGKEIVQKMDNKEGRQEFDPKVDPDLADIRALSGDGLKVGGEGMKTFYDTIVPTALKKLLPKVGGKGMAEFAIDVGLNGSLSYEIKERDDGRFALRGRVDANSDWAPYGVYATRALAQKRMSELKAEFVANDQPGFDVTPEMREKASGGLPMFSRAVDAWQNIAKEDDAFKYKKSDKKSFQDISKDLLPALVWQDKSTRYQTELQAEVQENRFAIFRERNGQVWLDVQELESGESRGSAIYNLVANYAFNNGRVFIGDPAGLSPTGAWRRLSNMISSSLKFGTTDHLFPHPNQFDPSRAYDYNGYAEAGEFAGNYLRPIDWRDGDTRYNLAQMLEAESDSVLAAVPELRDVRFDFEVGQFLDRSYNPFSDDAFTRAAESPAARSASAGSSTLKRAVFTRSVLLPVDRGGLDAVGERVLTSGVNGTFGRSPLYSRNVPTPGVNFELPARTVRERISNQLANEVSRVQAVQESVAKQGGVLTDNSDVQMAQTRMYRKAGAQIEKFRETKVRPILKRIAKADIDPDDIALYLYAVHARLRNQQIAAINSQFPDGGSGMFDAEAKAFLKSFRSRPDFQTFKRLARELQAITKDTQQLLLSSGLVDRDTVNSWNAVYKGTYVPLKGWEDVDDSMRSTGKMDPRVPFAKRALGRGSRAGQIIENILGDHERAIVMAEKNAVRQAFLRFVLDNKDDLLWEVNRVILTRRFNKGSMSPLGIAQGNVSYVATVDNREANTVAVRVNGKMYSIWVKDAAMLADLNAAIAAADGDVKMMTQAWRSINRGLAKLWTALSPAFVLINAVRDLQSAMIQTGVEKKGGVLRAAGMLPKLLPLAWNIWRAERTGDWTMTGNRYKQAYNEYRDVGAMQSFAGLETLEQKQVQLNKIIAEAKNSITLNPKSWYIEARKFIRAAEEFIMDINGSIENAARVAAYSAARQAGESVKEAVDTAANVTVDFARRGKKTPLFSSLYLFFNPAVQGTRRVAELAFSKKGSAVVSSLVALGYFNAMMAVGAVGDDDEPYWDKPNMNGVKHKNLLFFDAEGNQYKIPLTYGWGFFVNLGQGLYDLQRGKEVGKVASFLTSAFFQHFSPLGSTENLATFVAPTLFDPIAVLTMNKTEQGFPLKPEDRLGEEKPDSEKYWTSSRGTYLQKFTEWLNEATQGSKAYPGKIDVSPETLKYLIGFTTGGAGSFVRDTVSAIDLELSIGDGAAIQKNQIPILKAFYQTKTIKGEQSAFFENSAEAVKALEEAKLYWGKQAPNAVMERINNSRGLAALGNAQSNLREALGNIRKMEIAVIDNESMSRAEKESARLDLDRKKKELYDRFNRAFYTEKKRME